MTRCTFCNKGLSSTYIRSGSQGAFKKIGYSCTNCNIHFDKKLYTVNEKQYTVSHGTQTNKTLDPNNHHENISRNSNNHISPTRLNHDKLYNCADFIHPKGVRSVVRISRRSSEPQVMGSKPTGPAVTLSPL